MKIVHEEGSLREGRITLPKVRLHKGVGGFL
jgi:hypothetical protein